MNIRDLTPEVIEALYTVTEMTTVRSVLYYRKCLYTPESHEEKIDGEKFYNASAILCNSGFLDLSTDLFITMWSKETKKLLSDISEQFEF